MKLSSSPSATRFEKKISFGQLSLTKLGKLQTSGKGWKKGTAMLRRTRISCS
jgi:hypothetical protein